MAKRRGLREDVGRGKAGGAKASKRAAAIAGLVSAASEGEGPRPIAFFDLETEEWDRFVLGGLVAQGGDYYESRDEEAFFARLEDLGASHEIYAWNGGRYDFLWAIGRAIEAKRRAAIGLAGSRVTSIRWEGGAVWKDAVALIPASLEAAASIAGLSITKETGLPCRCGDACGGYCSIRRRMPASHWRSLSRYLRIDCETGLAIVIATRAEADRSGYTLGNTIGTTAWKTAKATCSIDDADWEPSHYALARSGYYGGRVEVFRPRAPRVYGVDINSAYPAALAVTPLPVGDSIVIAGKRAGRAFGRGREGIYGARVVVPPMLIPPLPARVEDRVIYPIGPIEGAWSRIELAYAIECGARVESWARAIVWEDADRVLEPFVRRAWDRRAAAAAAGNAGLKQWHKLVANSLTGKLAQAPEMERVTLNPKEIQLCPAEGCEVGSARDCRRTRKPWSRCCAHHCSRRCKGMRQLDHDGAIWSAGYWRIPESGHVHWAAYLTAATRIELHRQLVADGAGGATAVYCDTDSVRATARRTRRLGADLGEWGDEGAFADWVALAPKTYRYTKAAGGSSIKAKGLPDMDDDAWADFAAGRPVKRDRGVVSLKQAAAAGGPMFSRRNLSRAGHFDGLWYGGRKLGADGRTYPVTIADFEAREESE